ncbi:MAG: FAD-binding protein, partial [Hyphomicrobium sp.]
MIARLTREKRGIEVVGHGALRNTGRAVKADIVLTTSGLKGVTLYEPTELVMSARAGT